MSYNGRSEAMTLEVLTQVFDMLVVMLKSWRLEPDMLPQGVVELLDEHPGARDRNTRSCLWRCLGFARTGLEMFVFYLLYQI